MSDLGRLTHLVRDGTLQLVPPGEVWQIGQNAAGRWAPTRVDSGGFVQGVPVAELMIAATGQNSQGWTRLHPTPAGHVVPVSMTDEDREAWDKWMVRIGKTRDRAAVPPRTHQDAPGRAISPRPTPGSQGTARRLPRVDRPTKTISFVRKNPITGFWEPCRIKVHWRAADLEGAERRVSQRSSASGHQTMRVRKNRSNRGRFR